MLELARPILAKPELMSKIDTDFLYILKDEFKYTETDPVKTELKEPPKISKDFGTVTKFYFYAQEAVRLHFVPVMQEILDSFTEFQRLEDRVKSLPPNHHLSRVLAYSRGNGPEEAQDARAAIDGL